MATTTNYSWVTPDDTSLVKDGAAAIRTLGSSIDTTVFNNANAAIAKTIVDAKGDIIAATAADTVSRLAVGANNTVLTADSSTATGLKWAAPASGSLTLISTTSLTGASIALTSIPQTYKMLRLIVKDFYHSGGGGTYSNLEMIVNSTTGIYGWNGTTTAGNAQTFTTLKIRIAGDVEGADDNNLVITDIYEYANTSTMKYVDSKAVNGDGAGGASYNLFNLRAGINTTSAISSITLSWSANNFANNGTVELWGIN